ncbi:hypothetical protein QBC43DRAFT_103522 [Cladorrhinum sp. PSN259]|nr:hypothetical protein QBC43DRAFT_103522 [Cladorrhinum sp. PSN259]
MNTTCRSYDAACVHSIIVSTFVPFSLLAYCTRENILHTYPTHSVLLSLCIAVVAVQLQLVHPFYYREHKFPRGMRKMEGGSSMWGRGFLSCWFWELNIG